MADKLIFPIGFDLESAVVNAEKEGKAAMERLGKVFSREPIILQVEGKGFEALELSTDGLKDRLKTIKELWNSLPTSAKFDLDDNGSIKRLTTTGRALWEELNRIITALNGVGMDLEKMASRSIKQLEEEEKAAQKAAEAEAKAAEKVLEARRKLEQQVLQKEWNTAADQHKREQLEEEKRTLTETNKIRKEAEAMAQREAQIEKLILEFKLKQQQAAQAKKKASDEDYQNLVRQLREEERLSAEKARQKALDIRRANQAEAAAAIERERDARHKLFEAKKAQWQAEQKAINSTSVSYDALMAKLRAWQNIQNRNEVGSNRWEEAAQAILNTKKELAALTEEMNRSAKAQERLRQLREILSANERTLSGLNAKLSEYTSRIQGLEIGSAKFNKTALEIRRITEELQRATQQMQDFQQKSFSGVSDSLTKGKVQELTQFREQLRQVEQEFNRLNQTGAAYNTNGTLTSAANDLLKQRQQIIKQINQMLTTAADAQIQREKEINAVIEQRKAKEAEIKAARQAQLAQLARKKTENDRIRKILAAEENTVSAINAKLQVQQQRLNATSIGSNKFNRIALDVERLTKKLEEAKKKIAEMTGQQTRQTTAVQQTTKEYSTQTSYLERMVQRLAIYYSIGQVTSFLSRVREVTAQFELQRVSLGAIIQDQTRANALFSEIKQFALKSPISIMDLTKYTKQVAAYRIETDKLFDTTKRLADVSVGLGVDMGRLVLAYGQVKAASYLRAAEIRQFTEAGIPMLELLAEKFTALEGNVVSTEEVMDKVSKRLVSFSMVEQIFEDMTSAGGMFYNMQEKQGNTLFGMWAKLGDAASVMYDEIGNTEYVNSGMKDLIRTLTSMMRNWQSVAHQMALMGVEFAAYKLYTKAAAIYTDYLTAAQKANSFAQKRMFVETMSNNAATRNFYGLLRKVGVSMKSSAAATNVFAMSLRALKAAFVTTGIGALVVAISYLIEKLLFAKSTADEVKEALGDVLNETYTQQGQSTRNFEYLANAALDTSRSYKEQQDALAELQRTYKDILPMEVMEIDYLKSLNGDYSSLTDTISRYIAVRQEQKALDTIGEKYGAKMRESETKLSDKMKEWGWSSQEIGRFWGAFEVAAKDSTKKIEDMIKDALDYAGKAPYFDKLITQEFVYEKDAPVYTYDVVNRDLQEYLKNLQQMIDAEDEVKAKYETLKNGASNYAKAIKNINEQMENYQPTALVGGKEQGVDADSFVGKQARINERVTKLNEALYWEFYRGGKEVLSLWGDTFSKMVDVVDAEKPELISSIDFTEIIKALSAKLNDKNITDAQRQYLTELGKTVQKAQMEYNKFVPSDSTMITWNTKMRELADGIGIVEKKYTQYTMKSGEGLETWNKRLKDSVQEIKNNIKGLVATIATMQAIGRPEFMEAKEGELEVQKQRLELLEKILALQPDFGKEKTSKADNRVQQEKEYLSVLEKVYAKYKELKKSMSETEALQFMNKYYKDSIDYLEKHGLGLAKDAEEYKKYVSVVKANMQKLAKDKNKTVAAAAKKEVAEIDVKLGDVDFGELNDAIQKKLKQLSEEVAKSKEAKEFFDKIFSQTKNYDMAMQLTMSIYGDTGEKYQQQIIDQLQTAFGGGQEWAIDITPAINIGTGEVNYNILEDMLGSLPKEYQDEAKKIIEDLRKVSETQAKQWAKDLEKAKTYASETVELSRWTSTQKIAIEQNLAKRIAGIKYEQQQGKIDSDTAERQIAEAQKAAKAMLEGYELRQKNLQQSLDFDFLKNSELYATAFDNLDSLSRTTLVKMRERFAALRAQMAETLTPDQYADFVKKIQDIDSQLAKRSPIIQLTKNWKEYIKTLRKTNLRRTERQMLDNEKKLADASNRLKKALEEEAAAEDKLATARMGGNVEQIASAEKILEAKKETVENTQKEVDELEKVKSKLQEVAEGYNNAKDVVVGAAKQASEFISGLSTAFEGLATWTEVFGGSEEDVQFLQDISGGLSQVAGGIDEIVQAALSGNIGALIGGIISAPANMVQGFMNIFSAGKVKKANKEIKKQEKILESLEKTYENLQDQIEKAFGTEYIENYNNRLENLQAQATAKYKQNQAELRKGKKADKDKAKDYLNEYEDILKEIEDIKATEITQTLLGTGVSSAAVDFANAWLDAYVSFENTADAIADKYNDMMKSLVVQNVLAGAVQAALTPIFDKVKEYALSGGRLDTWEMTDIANDAANSAESINGMLTSIVQSLEQAGFDVRSLGEAADDTSTGIKRDIATASEESINGLAAGINTQNYYIAQIHANVAMIAQRMLGGGEQIDTAGGNESPTLQHLAYLPTIAQNTAETVVRCERAAIACEEMAAQIGRVIKPRGVESQYVVNIN